MTSRADYDPSDVVLMEEQEARAKAKPAPKQEPAPQRKRADIDSIAGLLESIAYSLQTISETLSTMRPSIQIDTPPAQVTVLQPETKREVRILRDERTRMITGAVSEESKK